ncbi:SCP domain-containing protein [Balamuthia mandrillaris]
MKTVTLLLLVVACLAAVRFAHSLGCPCVDGQAFPPTSGPGRLFVPKGKNSEELIERFLGHFLLGNRRGQFAASRFNEPTDLRDYAYEHSKMMHDAGEVLFNQWPTSCASIVSGNAIGDPTSCDWEYYRDNRQYYIQQVQSIDFTAQGFPLQGSTTNGRGYCVAKVEEFYGRTFGFSADELLKSMFNTTEQIYPGRFNGLEDAFPLEDAVADNGQTFFGIGVYSREPEIGLAPVYVTIIKVVVAQRADCECAPNVCAAFSGFF